MSALADDLTYSQALSEAVLHESNGQAPGALTWLDIATDTILDAAAPDDQPMDIQQLSQDQLRPAAKFIYAGRVFVPFNGRLYDAKGALLE